MTSFNNKVNYNNNNQIKKNNFLMFFLIFLLLVLMITSILIFKRFTYSSKNIKTISTNYELKFIDIYQKVPEEEVSPEEESYQNIVLKSDKNQSTSNKETFKNIENKNIKNKSSNIIIEEKKKTNVKNSQTLPTKKNKTKSISSKTQISKNIITAQNIKKYHNILLKQFKNSKIIQYKVKWGDTLWKIALKYNTSAHTIYVLNAFNNPDLIVTGQVIKVPVNFILKKSETKSILSNLIKQNSAYGNNQNKINSIVYNYFSDIIDIHFNIYYNNIYGNYEKNLFLINLS